jgi:hypothetical protein
MALLYSFDSAKTIANQKYPTSAETIAKVQKALAAKKVAKPQIDTFVTKLKAQKFSAVSFDAQEYIRKNQKGASLIPMDANAAEKAFAVLLLGPQKLVLMAKFDLSVHEKGGKLELQHTSCKGIKKTLFAV